MKNVVLKIFTVCGMLASSYVSAKPDILPPVIKEYTDLKALSINQRRAKALKDCRESAEGRTCVYQDDQFRFRHATIVSLGKSAHADSSCQSLKNSATISQCQEKHFVYHGDEYTNNDEIAFREPNIVEVDPQGELTYRERKKKAFDQCSQDSKHNCRLEKNNERYAYSVVTHCETGPRIQGPSCSRIVSKSICECQYTYYPYRAQNDYLLNFLQDGTDDFRRGNTFLAGHENLTVVVGHGARDLSFESGTVADYAFLNQRECAPGEEGVDGQKCGTYYTPHAYTRLLSKDLRSSNLSKTPVFLAVCNSGYGDDPAAKVVSAGLNTGVIAPAEFFVIDEVRGSTGTVPGGLWQLKYWLAGMVNQNYRFFDKGKEISLEEFKKRYPFALVKPG